MPPYLTRKDNTYYFRLAVPVKLRAILGKREIKKSLDRDYVRAVRDCKRFAVEADGLIADARASSTTDLSPLFVRRHPAPPVPSSWIASPPSSEPSSAA